MKNLPTPCESSFFGASATAATATVAVVFTAAATVSVTVAAEGCQKKYDDEKPNNIVVIKNIAKTIHKISSLRR